MYRSLVTVVAVVGFVGATVNEPCYGPSGAEGVCLTTSACSSGGGSAINGACPWDAADVKCCSKTTCGSGSPQNCRWTSDCTGTTVANQCPGPAGFKCCSAGGTGFGGYAAPVIPGVGGCKQVAVDGAKKIVAAWPGRIRQIYCTRDCTCGVDDSDHCCGKATDMMCSDAGGTATLSGKQIAEWVMNNRGTLNLKYVIWGQKIWNPSQDSVKSWDSWRTMENRGDVTQNHWDHVHVSYN